MSLTITSPTSILLQESLSGKSSQREETPSFVSFTILEIILSAAVLLGSNIYFRKTSRLVKSISEQM
ncbi:MAG TPA: hypothetical protein VKA09_01415 [Nitrososphaeraceae archaeon]|nr:hypothetical protein [Nitrososphaeraceae archaeon]